MAELTSSFSVITLHVNVHSSRKAETGKIDEKHDPTIHCIQEDYFKSKDTWVETERMKKDTTCKSKKLDGYNNIRNK